VAVAPDDADAFHAAVVDLVADPDRLRRMGASGRRFVESWASPAAVAARYEALFEELVARAAYRPRRVDR
jgi:colanic acid biosynthesis glycosyl transferase WcaI